MGAQLLRIDDPRTPLDKAKRPELLKFARQHGVSEITEDMPAILMRRILRNKGLVNIRIPPRVLGQPSQVVADSPADLAPSNGVEVDAGDDLLRQWQAESSKPKPPAQDFGNKQEINFLRAECQRLGIKMERRDNKVSLRVKVDAKLAELAEANGKDTAQRRQ